MIDLRVHDHELHIYDAAYTRAPVARTRERVRAVRYPRKVMLTNVCLYGPQLRRPGRPRRRRRERPRCERGAPRLPTRPRIAAPPRPAGRAGSRRTTAEWLRGIIVLEPLETLVNKKMRLKTREHPREQVRCATLMRHSCRPPCPWNEEAIAQWSEQGARAYTETRSHTEAEQVRR